jgi:hypothetical protein
LAKVAAFHFPEIQKRGDLIYIASYALREENFLQTIERISKRARYTARRRGLAEIGMALIKETIDAMFPKTKEPTQHSPEPAQDRPIKAPLTAPLRGLKPATTRGTGLEVFQDRSLRGAGRDSEKTEVVSADS